MTASEFIRTDLAPSGCGLLSVPTARGSAVLTFLHAGHPSWPKSDPGPKIVSERGHAHDVYHAVLYTAGSNTMVHDAVTHPSRRGTLVLTDPGTVHEYRPQSPGGGSFIELTFDLRSGQTPLTKPWREIVEHWLGIDIGRRTWPLIVPPPALENMESLMDRVVRDLTGPGAYREVSAAIAMGSFILGLAEYLRDEEQSSGAGTDRLEQARKTLEKRFALPITIRELATVACLSEGAFIRAFSGRYGMPPMVYRKELRIAAAKHLLSVSGRAIGEIASNVGYGDIFAFSKTFKAVTGTTASNWRSQQNRQDKAGQPPA